MIICEEFEDEASISQLVDTLPWLDDGGCGNLWRLRFCPDKHETAKQNVQRLCEQAAKAGNDNPSTRMHELVAVLESDEVRGSS